LIQVLNVLLGALVYPKPNHTDFNAKFILKLSIDYVLLGALVYPKLYRTNLITKVHN